MIYFGSPNPTNMEQKLINKSSGSVFILLYILYLVFLIFESKNSDSKLIELLIINLLLRLYFSLQ